MIQVGTGYSGLGSALDDPAAKYERKKGPIRRGAWLIGKQRNHKLADGHGTLTAAMPLTPAPGNQTDRKDFWIHGDTAAHNQTSSQCCIRDEIAASSDRRLQVVHP